MAKERVLVVDDEEDILELVAHTLTMEGYQVSKAATGEEGLQQARATSPDLIVLDIMLPGLDGLEVCRVLRSRPETSSIPIVMLTAKGAESDIVAGLELGADDYIIKPFSPKVLIARIRNVLRRSRTRIAESDSVITIHGITIDPGRHTVRVGGEHVNLTITEFGILHALARRPGWVFTRYQLVEETRGDDYEVTDRSVDVHIVSLRRKLGDAGAHLETVRGVGYRLKE